MTPVILSRPEASVVAPELVDSRVARPAASVEFRVVPAQEEAVAQVAAFAFETIR